MTFRAPKYSCTICNKVFRRKKSHFNHIMNAHKKRGMNKKQIVVEQIVLKTIEAAPYIGRPYNFVNIPSGNRHLRAGIPMQTISKDRYRSAAI